MLHRTGPGGAGVLVAAGARPMLSEPVTGGKRAARGVTERDAGLPRPAAVARGEGVGEGCRVVGDDGGMTVGCGGRLVVGRLVAVRGGDGGAVESTGTAVGVLGAAVGGGAAVFVGGAGVAVGGTGVSVGNSGGSVGGRGVGDGGTGVSVGGRGVGDGSAGVAVDGSVGVLVGRGVGVLVGRGVKGS